MNLTVNHLLFVGTLTFAWYVGRIVLPYGAVFLKHYAVVERNFRGTPIPTSYGFVLLIAYFFVSFVVYCTFHWLNLHIGPLFWALATVSLWVVFLGWLDDTLGERQIKGFYGHFRAILKRGVVTTGLLKAVGGGGAAYAIAFLTADHWGEWFVHGTLVALSTNWLNLLDLRPGRAAKFYLLFAGLFVVLAWPNLRIVLFLPLFGLVAATLSADLRAALMLGDSGANLLGMQLGVFATAVLPVYVCFILLILFTVGHVYAERYSLTDLISQITWLRKLDQWGRT